MNGVAQPISQQPSDPIRDSSDIIGKKFTSVRRGGYDPGEVHRFLRDVADELADARKREAEARSRLAKAVRRADDAEHLTEAELTDRLGDEVSHVLQAAREASQDRIARALAQAEQTIATAEADGTRIRGAAKTILSERTGEANAAADGIISDAETVAANLRYSAEQTLDQAQRVAVETLDKARREGEGLIEQAEAARSQILLDMDRRRRTMRSQVELLKAGRDRLMQSHEALRRSLDEIHEELRISVVEAKIKGDNAERRVLGSERATAPGLEAELVDAAMVGLIELPKVERLESQDVDQLPNELANAVTRSRSSELSGGSDRPAGAEADDRTVEPAEPAEPDLDPGRGSDGDDDAVVVQPVADNELEVDAEETLSIDDASVDAEMHDALDAAIPAIEIPVAPDPVSIPVITDTANTTTATTTDATPLDEYISPQEISARLAEERATDLAQLEAAKAQEEAARAQAEQEAEAARAQAEQEEAARAQAEQDAEEARAQAEQEAEEARAQAEQEAEEAAATTDLTSEVGTESGAGTAATANAAVLPSPELPAGQAHASAGSSALCADLAGEPIEATSGSAVDRLFADLRGAPRQNEPAEAEPVSVDADTPATTEPPVDADISPDMSPDDASTSPDMSLEISPDANATDAVLATVRDNSLADIITNIERRIKRVLADEQNTTLEGLRAPGRSGPKPKKVPTIELLPPVDDQLDGYFEAIAALIDAAYGAGAAFVDPAVGVPDQRLPADGRAAVQEVVAQGVTTPIRDRFSAIDVDIDDTEASNIVSAFYRQHKIEVVGAAARKIAHVSFAFGTMHATPDGVGVRWGFQDCDGGCVDGHDNSLDGVVRPGKPFVSGHMYPPVGARCRCVLIPADR